VEGKLKDTVCNSSRPDLLIRIPHCEEYLRFYIRSSLKYFTNSLHIQMKFKNLYNKGHSSQ